jgi:hypothetical protein
MAAFWAAIFILVPFAERWARAFSAKVDATFAVRKRDKTKR